MRVVVSQIVDVSIVYSTVGSGADQNKDQSSAFSMFPFDDVIMIFIGPNIHHT